MTSLKQRQPILKHVKEAIVSGAEQKKACELIGLNERTFQRWFISAKGDLRPLITKSNSKKLTEKERKNILKVCNSTEYLGSSPNEIVPKLAEKGIYIACETMFYKVLRENKQLKHRTGSKLPNKKRPPTLVATGPNQVWSWDITYLKRDIHGVFYYLYLFMDIWSRKIVGWTIAEFESGDIAANTLERLCNNNNIEQIWLHSDNGSPMKCATMLSRMEKLGVLASFSRPAVSNDNPFSESLFKTLKYRPGYPGKFFTLDEANSWVNGFVSWYNYEHLHSGIKYVTPEQRHTGEDIIILKNRKRTYEHAREKMPSRWTGKIKNFDHIKVVELNGKHTKKTIKKRS